MSVERLMEIAGHRQSALCRFSMAAIESALLISFVYPLKFGPSAHNMCSSYKEVVAMNFNIYLDDETGQQLNHVAKQAGENRNALVRRAVSEWLSRHGKPQWPDEVLAFRGMADMPPFEAGRDSIKPPVADPLA